MSILWRYCQWILWRPFYEFYYMTSPFKIKFHTFKVFEKASHASRLQLAMNHWTVYSASFSMMESKIASPERLSYLAFKTELWKPRFKNHLFYFIESNPKETSFVKLVPSIEIFFKVPPNWPIPGPLWSSLVLSLSEV